MTEPRDVLARYHQAMLDKSADDLADLYAVDAVHEFPMLFPGMPQRLEGREQVRAQYRAAWGAMPGRLDEIRNVIVHDTTDPEVIIVEADIAGTLDASGASFGASGLLVIRVRDGAIVHVRDYLDGLAINHAMGSLPAVVDALDNVEAEARGFEPRTGANPNRISSA